MFRRASSPSTTADRPTAAAGPRPDLAAELSAAGWALPRGIGADGPPRWTLVGTVGSPTATPVDPRGLVVAEGWSLDWWIGADDHWHLPSRSAAVRQQLVGEAPVVETLLRVPGGDAAHRAYGIRSPRPVGDEWVVAEVENATAVPFAVALVLRPLVADGVGSVGRITIEPTEGGRGRDVAHLVRVDGRPAVLLPRRPTHLAAGNRADGDVVDIVTSGQAGTDLIEASCPDGLATLALVFPLIHTAVLRVALPVGEVGDEPLAHPAVVPESAVVASGWDVHRRGPRFELPDQRLAKALARSRAAIALAHDGEVVRRDGHRAPDLEPGATEVILGAFDLLDRPDEVGEVVARWTDRLAAPTPAVDALALGTIARHWLLHRRDELLDWLLPEVAAAVERLDRAHRRGRLSAADDQDRAAVALADAARMFAAADQPEAATAVRALAARLGREPESTFRPEASARLLAAATAIARGDRAGLDLLDAEAVAASGTGAWSGPGPGGRAIGHDLAAAAALVQAVRALFVAERDDGLALLPVVPDGWYGSGVELHDAPTGHGMLSFAVRWHGARPALLWDLVPHGGSVEGADAPPPVRLTVPGLDPTWSTTELRGDALLAEVAPPEGLDLVRMVAEHADVPIELRKPGTEPDAPPPPLPEGGTFS